MSVVETGLQIVAPDATDCPLCSARDEGHARPAVEQGGGLLPWVGALTAAALFAGLGLDQDRLFGVGAAAGLLAGGTLAWNNVRSALRAARAEHERTVRALSDDADGRVNMVIRQFEWAVNDVAKLRREHERAQVTADLLVVQGRARERHVRKLEGELLESRERAATLAAAIRRGALQEPASGTEDVRGPVPIHWGLHREGEVLRLELACDPRYRTTRVRVVDADGTVLVRSMTAMHSGDGSLSFALAGPPAALVGDLLAGRTSGYTVQAQRDQQWRPVELHDSGRRTRTVSDKKGRQFRVSEAPFASEDLAVTPCYAFEYGLDSSVLAL